MESPERSEIKVFDYDHGTKDIGARRFIWLAEYEPCSLLTDTFTARERDQRMMHHE